MRSSCKRPVVQGKTVSFYQRRGPVDVHKPEPGVEFTRDNGIRANLQPGCEHMGELFGVVQVDGVIEAPLVQPCGQCVGF